MSEHWRDIENSLNRLETYLRYAKLHRDSNETIPQLLWDKIAKNAQLIFFNDNSGSKISTTHIKK